MSTPADRQAPRRNRVVLKVALRIGLAAALLGIVFYRIDFGTFASALTTINPWHLLGAYVSYVVSLVFKAFRWQRLGVTHRHVSVLDCFSATASGFLFGLTGPGMFEFTRAYVLKKRARVPFGSVVGIIVAERSLDTVLLVLTVFFVLLLVPSARWLSNAATALAVLVIIGLGLLVLLVWTRDRSIPRLERALARFSPKIARRVARFIKDLAGGLSRLGELKIGGAFEVLAFTALLWCSRGLYVLLVLRSLDLHAVFGLALLVAAVEYLGMLVRVTPAGIGQYQIIATAVLVAFSIEQSTAAGASILLHAVRLLVIFSVGLPFLCREHLGLSRLAKEKESAASNGRLFGPGATE